MKKQILFTVLCFYVQFLFSQENKNIDSLTTVIKDKRIDKLSENYRSTYKLKGYRIQIYSGNKRQPANQARLTFTRVYRKVKAHELYVQPHFKVRVGDFKTKIEALKFKNKLVKHFPNCFIVNDEIDINEIYAE